MFVTLIFFYRYSATPVRLSDLIQTNAIDVTTITYVVFDETDRMLNRGFEPQIRKIMLAIRPNHQIVMSSATWPTRVRQLAEIYMKNSIRICVGDLSDRRLAFNSDHR